MHRLDKQTSGLIVVAKTDEVEAQGRHEAELALQVAAGLARAVDERVPVPDAELVQVLDDLERGEARGRHRHEDQAEHHEQRDARDRVHVEAQRELVEQGAEQVPEEALGRRTGVQTPPIRQ